MITAKIKIITITDMKIKYVFCFIILFLFSQCKTSKLAQIRKEIRNSFSIKYLNKEDFDRSRSLMLEKLSPDILKNDTIIIIEGFYGFNGHYFVSIHESNNNKNRYYIAKSSIKEGKVHVDSLMLYPNAPNKVLDMVKKGELDEIKKRGDTTTLTPAATLIINIGVNNKETDKFDFTTLITRAFSTYED